jgi:hypothetical protein
LVFAQMAELVDALVSGTSVRKDVQVRVLFWAQKQSEGEREVWARVLAPILKNPPSPKICPGGGIGRRARLRA